MKQKCREILKSEFISEEKNLTREILWLSESLRPKEKKTVQDYFGSNTSILS